MVKALWMWFIQERTGTQISGTNFKEPSLHILNSWGPFEKNQGKGCTSDQLNQNL